jgi:hypothetical protein
MYVSQIWAGSKGIHLDTYDIPIKYVVLEHVAEKVCGDKGYLLYPAFLPDWWIFYPIDSLWSRFGQWLHRYMALDNIRHSETIKSVEITREELAVIDPKFYAQLVQNEKEMKEWLEDDD